MILSSLLIYLKANKTNHLHIKVRWIEIHIWWRNTNRFALFTRLLTDADTISQTHKYFFIFIFYKNHELTFWWWWITPRVIHTFTHFKFFRLWWCFKKIRREKNLKRENLEGDFHRYVQLFFSTLIFSTSLCGIRPIIFFHNMEI